MLEPAGSLGLDDARQKAQELREAHRPRGGAPDIPGLAPAPEPELKQAATPRMPVMEPWPPEWARKQTLNLRVSSSSGSSIDRPAWCERAAIAVIQSSDKADKWQTMSTRGNGHQSV